MGSLMTRPNPDIREQKRKDAYQQLKKKYDKPISLKDIKEALQRHHWECVFEVDAPRKIYDRLKHGTYGYWVNHTGPHHTLDPTKAKSRMKEFTNAFVQSEIYCPHEGVDRRKEYNVL